ncbi:Copper amine oxidase N-terminal domain-containing protein (plasmid) [Carboxydocella thermautotrophica]|nr:Copper amine oxidase N-terminal domain-containing protein [Carboxydocella thermautotrophica]
MTRFISVMAVVLSFFITTSALAQPEIMVYVNGRKISFPDQKPFLDNKARTLVPVRFVSEALGATVDWDGRTQTVTIKHRANTIKLKIGESKAMVNGKAKTFDTKAILKNKRTMVPLRFITEALGARVTWDNKTYTVKVSMDNGYTLPEKTDLTVELYPPNNVNNVDINIAISVEDDLEKQFTDLYNILASKFGEKAAREITDHVRLKKDRWSEVPEKYWIINNQKIRVASNAGGYTVQVIVWLPGVK